MAKAKFNNDEPHLFKEKLEPAKPGSGELFRTEYESGRDEAVECLGITFANDEDRRKHFLCILREKLKDPEFRKIEGFPLDILLCTQRDHTLVEYALAGMDNSLFVSKYQLELPKKEEMQRFIEEQVRETGA